MIEFKDKKIDREYDELEERALALDNVLRAIEERMKFLRENYEQE